MLEISNQVAIPSDEIEINAMRAQGAGGQHVNKVATAVHLRFFIKTSSLPEFYKERLLALNDHRITKDGVVVIKAQRYRSQQKNQEEALARLRGLIQRAVKTRKKRKPTKPTRGSEKKRLDRKNKRGRVKALRGKVTE